MVKLHHKYSVLRNLVNIIKGGDGVSFDHGKRATPLLKQKNYSFDPLENVVENISGYQKLVYICSPTQRSGTNFIYNTLSLHADLQGPLSADLPNEHFLYSHADLLSKYLQQTIGYWPKWVKEKELLTNMHAEMLAGMGDGLLNPFYSRLKDKSKILMLRTPDAGNLEYFPAMFPAGKLVVILRDGRDTVNSFVKSFSGNWAFSSMAKRWAARIDYLYELQGRLQKKGLDARMRIFRYEDLNEHPEETVKEILKFLALSESGFNWEKLQEVPVVGSSTMYNKHQEKEFWKPMQKTDAKKFTRRWADWTKSKKKNFKRYAGKQLIKAGYATDLNW